MRPLEALLAAALIVALLLRWIKPRSRQFTASTLAMIGILLGLHLFFDGPRWEMIPAYGMVLAAAAILSGDLRRVSGAKAGESSRWMAVPSAGKRIVTGLALLFAAVIAIVLPLWVFPRIVLPVPDGLYYVGRIDVDWTDSARAMAGGTPRPVGISVWYPAESPAGRALRYHPHPGLLGRDLAAGTPLPAFTFRNLTAARTHSTAAPRFSIREGRSPVVVVSHDVGGDRMEGTAMFEELASTGYVVVSIDHAGSAAGATFADGSPVPMSPAAASEEIEQRVADIRFVFDRLNRLPVHDATDSLSGHIRLDRVAFVGRGLGASAAAEAIVSDSRITAGVGLALDTIARGASGGVHRPFLIFTVPGKTTNLDDIFRFGGTEVRLDGATANSLSDLALLGEPIVRMLGIQSEDSPADIHAAVTSLTLRFLNQYLRDRQETNVDLPPGVQVQVVPHEARQ